jgi:4-hydroxysphinganine ceramide fatty acyl 2-hydroxylase
MSKTKIYTEEDLAPHNYLKSCWVTRNGKVYDVTEFLADHPGGEELIIKHGGKDVGEVMKDNLEHLHSGAAYEMLEEYVIGRLGTDANIVSEGVWIRILNVEKHAAYCCFRRLGS